MRHEKLVLAGLITILLAEAALSLCCLNAPPIWDDHDEIAHVRSAGSWTRLLGADCYGFVRPIKNALFAAEDSLAPGSSAARHVTCGCLYALCTVLAFLWLRRRIGHAGWAVAATAIWALAPTQVSSIAWFSCVNILFGASCALGAAVLFDHVGGPETTAVRRRLTLAGVITLYVLAILSYESYLVLPALLLLQQGHRARELPRRTLVAPYCWMALAAALCLLARRFAQSGFSVRNDNFGPMSGWQVSVASAWLTLDHLAVYLWPFRHQSLTGPFVWGVSAPLWRLALSWAILAALAAMAWRTRKRQPLIAFGLAWAAIAYVPTSNLLPLRNGPFGDYYLVLPSIGLALTLAAIARAMANSQACRRIGWVLALVVVVWRGAAAITSFDWARTWNSEEEIDRRTLLACPDAFTARANLARFLLLHGRLDEAEVQARIAHDAAAWSAPPRYVLGDVYMRRGDLGRAIDEYHEGLRIRPSNPYPYFAIGFIQEKRLNDPNGAIASYGRVLACSWNESSSGAAGNLSMLLARQGRLNDAISVVNAALAHEPRSPQLHYAAAVVWKMRGNLALAQNHLDQYNQLRGNPTL